MPITDEMAASHAEEEEDDLLLRRLIPCEQDRRRLFPTTPWTGGYRWFRSLNVVDLEVRRKLKKAAEGQPRAA
jgi:hypothetical protein